MSDSDFTKGVRGSAGVARGSSCEANGGAGRFRATVGDFMEELSGLSVEPSVRRRYAVLNGVLVRAVDSKLVDVKINFSGLFSKIDYLLKEYRVKQSDRSLSLAVNDARVRMKQTDTLPDATLDEWFALDLKAVAVFVATIFESEVPAGLRAKFPMARFHRWRERMKDGEGRSVAALRCVVDSMDDRYIYCTREDNGEEMRVDYMSMNDSGAGDWSYLRKGVAEGEVLSIVKPRHEDGIVYPELVVASPDCLVNVTTVAGCFESYGLNPLTSLLMKLQPDEPTAPKLLGNFASQLLDETVYGEDIPYAESIKTFFRKNALGFLACDDIGPDFHQSARRQRENIRHIFRDVYSEGVKTEFRTGRVILEPSFFSPVLGLQGRMDFLDLSYKVVIEQKSGKGGFVPGCPPDRYAGPQEKHLVQMLLYRALLHYDYSHVDYGSLHSFLLYSRYYDGLSDVASVPRLLFEAVKMRNRIVWCERLFASDGLGLMLRLTPERLYPEGRGKLWEGYVRPKIENVLGSLQNAPEQERDYCLRFMKFIAVEQQLARTGNKTKENSGFAATWNSSVEEKRQAGNIYERLRMEDCAESHIEDVTFAFDEEQDTDMSNFRKGDIVFFYPYERGEIPDATRRMVFRATIISITTRSLKLRLRNPQTSRTVFDFYRKCLWAVEHDFMEASFGSLYRATYSLLSATQPRRDLLMNRRRPAVDRSERLRGDYSDSAFGPLVLHAMQARDIYLVIGPPGTGKTSFGLCNILHEQLLRPGTSVLLIAYTNRAVDEICSKLVAMDDGQTDFIRLGNDFSCEDRYRKYLLSSRIDECDNIGDVQALIDRTRVFCGTTTSVNSSMSLFKVKRFDLAIVDEASQILEPHIVGLFSARHRDEDAIGRFVLIGDEKQLPAVVQQTHAESVVREPKLNAIGLTDCSLSLFERLLRLYGYDADGRPNPDFCSMLTHQGRMHPDIAGFPNDAFYGGSLSVVPLSHQLEPGSQRSSEPSSLADVLATRRMAFVDCSPERGGAEADKVNKAEAEVIAAAVFAAYERAGAGFDPAMTVGVIVPYRNQIATVRSAVARYGVECLGSITIDTVERYQGSQRDVIVYGFTVRKPYQLAFLTDNEYVDRRDGAVIDRKLNVAMTRARKNLLLVGNGLLLSRVLTFRRLMSYAMVRGCLFTAGSENGALRVGQNVSKELQTLLNNTK